MIRTDYYTVDTGANDGVSNPVGGRVSHCLGR